MNFFSQQLPPVRDKISAMPNSIQYEANVKFKIKLNHTFLPHSENFHRFWCFIRCKLCSAAHLPVSISWDNEDLDRNFSCCDDTCWAIKSHCGSESSGMVVTFRYNPKSLIHSLCRWLRTVHPERKQSNSSLCAMSVNVCARCK